MKLKPLTWVLIISSSALLPLILILFITRLVINPPANWWYFYGFLIIELIMGAIIGIIVLFIRLSKEGEKPKGISKEDAIRRSIEYVKWHPTNPDNFKIENERSSNEGEKGSHRTAIVWMWGKGTELNQRIDFIVNLEESTKKKLVCTYLTEATEAEVQEAINKMAKNPTTEEKQERITTYDEFNRPITKVITKKVSEQQKKEEEEKRQEELKSGI